MIDLNEIKETSLQIAELRGQGTDVRTTLKHCAGEVLESYEAYGNWTFNNPNGKEDFALELAKVIINAGSVAYYDYNDGLWYDWNFDFEIEDEVIAWCAYPCYEGIEENSGN